MTAFARGTTTTTPKPSSATARPATTTQTSGPQQQKRWPGTTTPTGRIQTEITRSHSLAGRPDVPDLRAQNWRIRVDRGTPTNRLPLTPIRRYARVLRCGAVASGRCE